MDWLLGVSPILLIVLICPLMMIFMMRGMHGGHGNATEHDDHHSASEEDPERRLAQLEVEIGELKQKLGNRAQYEAGAQTLERPLGSSDGGRRLSTGTRIRRRGA